MYIKITNKYDTLEIFSRFNPLKSIHLVAKKHAIESSIAVINVVWWIGDWVLVNFEAKLTSRYVKILLTLSCSQEWKMSATSISTLYPESLHKSTTNSVWKLIWSWQSLQFLSLKMNRRFFIMRVDSRWKKFFYSFTYGTVPE